MLSSFFLFLRAERESNPGEHFTQEQVGTEPLDTHGRRLHENMSLSTAWPRAAAAESSRGWSPGRRVSEVISLPCLWQVEPPWMKRKWVWSRTGCAVGGERKWVLCVWAAVYAALHVPARCVHTCAGQSGFRWPPLLHVWTSLTIPKCPQTNILLFVHSSFAWRDPQVSAVPLQQYPQFDCPGRHSPSASLDTSWAESACWVDTYLSSF